MIKNAQRADVPASENVVPPAKRVFPELRARRLTAIEIAEGALLADIAVVFQLFIRYLPVGGSFLQLLVPVIFAVIVLRRGLYVGLMSLCVALFIIFIIMAHGGVPILLVEAGAGLFRGVTMRVRLSYMLTIALGVVGGALALWAVLLCLALLTGGPRLIIRPLHQAYAAVVPVLGFLFKLVRLASFWQHQLFPLLNAFMQWGFQNWLLLFYLLPCLVSFPLVICVFLI